MSKNKNHRIYSRDHAWLKSLADDQRNYIGRDTELDLANNMLTIFALPRKRNKEPKKNDETPRNKRAEAAARNS